MTHPLQHTLERADLGHEWLSVRYGVPAQPGWLSCADVDSAVIAAWESAVADVHRKLFGRTHPQAASGYVLGWYAGIAGSVGALGFLLDRRVPRLDRANLAFRRAESGYPDAIAVRDPRFWCLPTDPDARHPDATVAADEAALAAILRAEVRAHADAFLAAYRPTARLPRRHLLGAFFDGLDAGFWLSEPGPVSRDEVVATARGALPGRTAEFGDASSYYAAVDEAGRRHLVRRRVSCCYYFKVGHEGACTTCPRTGDAERLRRMSALADEAGAREETHA